jgi:hypothetical protein
MTNGVSNIGAIAGGRMAQRLEGRRAHVIQNYLWLGRRSPAAADAIFETSGLLPTVPIAVIDGPYDASGLAGVWAQAPINLGSSSCSINSGDACDHGTFIMGILGARRDASIPGLCADCRLLHVPLFVNENYPSATLSELAHAIRVAVAGGARLINLSLAILGDETQQNRELAAALDQAEAHGVVLVVAAGNQGRQAMGQLLSHPATIPVVAVDAKGLLLPDCNFGPMIAHRGVAAFGHKVLGYAPGGGTTLMSGTSVATAVASAALAQVWSLHSDLQGAEILAAVRSLSPREGLTPPLLNRVPLLAALDRMAQQKASARAASNYVMMQGGTTMQNEHGLPLPLDGTAEIAAKSGQAVMPAQGLGGCACGAPGGICACGSGMSGPSEFVYVLGSVDIRFPDQSISEELQIVAQKHGIKLDDTEKKDRGRKKDKSEREKKDEELRAFYFRVLKEPDARYVARQVCWILKVEGQIAYHLVLRDLHDLPDLISCLGHPLDADLDLFVGTSPLVEMEKCPGVRKRILTVEYLSSFEKDDLLKWFGASSEKSRKPRSRTRTTSGSDHDRNELYDMLVQTADNYGNLDEQRALNFLAIRYKPLYELYAEMVLSDPKNSYNLVGVEVFKSRLSADRQIVDPVITFERKDSTAVERYFVRVDVSHMFPVIVNHVAKYVARKS